MGADKIRVNNLKLEISRKRKGIIYSLLTLLLLTPSIILMIMYFNSARMEGQNLSNKIRADDLNSFHKSLLEDLSRSLKISTQRALLHADEVIATTGKPFLDSSKNISEMVLYGTLDGVDVPSLTGSGGSTCNTVSCWKDNYTKIAKQAGFDFSVKVVSVSITPYDSWNLNSSAEIEIFLKDTETNSSINHTVMQSSKVPITGFEDPLYLIKTNGKVSRLIKKPTTIPLVIGTRGFGWAIGITENDISSGNSNKTLVTTADLSTIDLTNFGSAVSENPADTIQHPFPFISNASGASMLSNGKKVFIENVTFSVWDLTSEINSRKYHESYYGPSYLDRLEGRTSISDSRKGMPNAIGLVSFVDPVEFISGGLTINPTLSCVDYLYFSGTSDGLC
jgi:hypothetical protein